MKHSHRTRWRQGVLAITAALASSAYLAGTPVTAAPAPSITGRVTTQSGSPVTGTVKAYLVGSATPAATTSLSGTGTYQFAGLPTGSYDVEFVPAMAGWNVLSEWYDNQPTRAGATKVAVRRGSTASGVNATLAFGPGSISGTVTRADGGPVTSSSAQIFGNTTGVSDSIALGADGRYRFDGLPPDQYLICFTQSDTGDGAITGECWDNTSYPTSSRVAVAQGQIVTGIDAELAFRARGGSISGTVTRSDGGSVATSNAQLFSTSGGHAGNATIAADGSYSFADIYDGGYIVCFTNSDTPDGRISGECWDDSTTVAGAQQLTVADRQHIGGVDAVLTFTPSTP